MYDIEVAKNEKWINWVLAGTKGGTKGEGWSDECNAFWCICKFISFSDVRFLNFGINIDVEFATVLSSCFYFTLELSQMKWRFWIIIQNIFIHDLWWQHGTNLWFRQKVLCVLDFYVIIEILQNLANFKTYLSHV